jgi:hypothetical protein
MIELLDVMTVVYLASEKEAYKRIMKETVMNIYNKCNEGCATRQIEELIETYNEAKENAGQLDDIIRFSKQVNGDVFISNDYFEEWAVQQADDFAQGDFNAWPLNCIDWKKAAEALKHDYTSIDINDKLYWIKQ